MVITLWQGLLTYAQFFGHKDGVEESVTSVNCAVSICEVKGKPAQVYHDNDAPFRTSRVGLLPFKFYSTSNSTEKMAAQQRNLKAIVMCAAQDTGCAVYPHDEWVTPHFRGGILWIFCGAFFSWSQLSIVSEVRLFSCMHLRKSVSFKHQSAQPSRCFFCAFRK